MKQITVMQICLCATFLCVLPACSRKSAESSDSRQEAPRATAEVSITASPKRVHGNYVPGQAVPPPAPPVIRSGQSTSIAVTTAATIIDRTGATLDHLSSDTQARSEEIAKITGELRRLEQALEDSSTAEALSKDVKEAVAEQLGKLDLQIRELANPLSSDAYKANAQRAKDTLKRIKDQMAAPGK